jgi:hypothetical protein
MSSNSATCSQTAHDAITEISVANDGRVYVFGASVAVLEALAAARIGGDALRKRLARVRAPRTECPTHD